MRFALKRFSVAVRCKLHSKHINDTDAKACTWRNDENGSPTFIQHKIVSVSLGCCTQQKNCHINSKHENGLEFKRLPCSIFKRWLVGCFFRCSSVVINKNIVSFLYDSQPANGITKSKCFEIMIITAAECAKRENQHKRSFFLLFLHLDIACSESLYAN